jgi:hypothetical protein
MISEHSGSRDDVTMLKQLGLGISVDGQPNSQRSNQNDASVGTAR